MSRKSVRQDLIIKGLDPSNVEIGADGLFVAKLITESDTNKEKVVKNALVHLPALEVASKNLQEEPTQEEIPTVEQIKLQKTKRKSKSE
jgi:hypothetical protein